MANLMLSATDAFVPLHAYLTHLPCPHTILSVVSFSLVGVYFRPSLSAFIVLITPLPHVCSKCVFSSSCMCICHTDITFISLSLESAWFCSHAWSFAAPRHPLPPDHGRVSAFILPHPHLPYSDHPLCPRH